MASKPDNPHIKLILKTKEVETYSMSIKSRVIQLLLCSSLSFASGPLYALSSATEQKPAQDKTELEAIQPNMELVRAADEILSKLQRRHYKKRAFNDELSSALFDNYLKRLDPAKAYFTQQDIDKFEQYRLLLDDGIRRGNLTPSFEIFNRYRDKIASHLDQLVTNLPQRIEALDFSLDESISLEPDTQPWAKDDAELANRARKSLKNAVLGLKLADKEPKAIV